MPRIKPTYEFEFSKGAPLKGERHSHMMEGKASRVSSGAKPPRPMSKRNHIKVEVHYGNHEKIARMIGNEMRKLGL